MGAWPGLGEVALRRGKTSSELFKLPQIQFHEYLLSIYGVQCATKEVISLLNWRVLSQQGLFITP